MALVFSLKVWENSGANHSHFKHELNCVTDPHWSQSCASLDQGWDAEHPAGSKPNLEHHQFWCLENTNPKETRGVDQKGYSLQRYNATNVVRFRRMDWFLPASFYYKFTLQANALICLLDPRAEHEHHVLHWKNIQDPEVCLKCCKLPLHFRNKSYSLLYLGDKRVP